MRAPTNPERILIIKLRAIGDVVMATPVIENLRLAYPDTFLVFLTEEASADILAGNPFLDEVLLLPRRTWSALPLLMRWRAQVRFYRTLRARRFDLVIDLFGNPRSAILSLLSGARHRLGYAFRMRKYCYTQLIRPRGGEVHEVEVHLDAVRALGVPTPISQPRVYVPEQAAQRAMNWMTSSGIADGERLIGLNPGGGWSVKRWPPERFAVLAARLITNYNVRIVLFWGPGEEPLVEAIRRQMSHPVLSIPAVSLSEMMAFLKHLALLISNDSGPMHIAAALCVPTIGIFGPTNPFLQGPYGPSGRAVREESVACLGCNQVTCAIGNICMTHLAPETVFSAVQSYFEQDA